MMYTTPFPKCDVSQKKRFPKTGNRCGYIVGPAQCDGPANCYCFTTRFVTTPFSVTILTK